MGKTNVNKQQNMLQRCEANFWQWMNGHAVVHAARGRRLPEKRDGQAGGCGGCLAKVKRQKLCANILWHSRFILFGCRLQVASCDAVHCTHTHISIHT